MGQPTLSEVLKSYERMLVAKAQINEFASWGGIMVTACHAQVEAHQRLEQSYISLVIEHRRQHGSGSLP